jgi:hypothetical protein
MIPKFPFLQYSTPPVLHYSFPPLLRSWAATHALARIGDFLPNHHS